MLTLFTFWLGTAAAAPFDAESAAVRALEVVPNLDAAAAARRQAESAVRIGAIDFVPTVDLQATYTRLSKVDQPPLEFGGTVIDSPFPQILNQYGLKASVTIPISHTFLATLPAYEASRHSAKVAAYQEEAERQGVALQARSLFYGHLRAKAGVGVASDGVALLEAYVADLEALLEAGQVTRADVLQTQAQLSQAQAQLAAAEGGVETTTVALERLLDLNPGELQVDDTLQPLEVPEGDLLAAALDERPEIRLLESLVDTHRAGRRAQIGARLPSLAVQGSLDYANPNQRQLTSTGGFASSWSATAVLSWSPNSFIGRQRDIDKAAVDILRAERDIEALEDQIANEVVSARTDMTVAQRTLTAAQAGVKAADEAWRVRRDLLTAGEGIPSDVLDAEGARRRANQSVVDAELGAHLARVRLQHVLGRAVPNSSRNR